MASTTRQGASRGAARAATRPAATTAQRRAPSHDPIPEGARPYLLTVEAAGELLAIGRRSVYRLIMSGELRSITIGRSRRIPVGALEEFVSRLSA